MICEENGQIIVDELRPMSEHLMDGAYILVWHKDGEAFREAFYFESGFYIINGIQVHHSDLIGWIPMPIYRPKDEK